ncbi:hypothetical protein CASFOL_010307 [Castilleja foliolosa]|uniref:BAH domain-containing protein n=1 Tax=Castilleja foliolosa TaxID=1961234 RepID=A0ABD3DU28_9LAMI
MHEASIEGDWVCNCCVMKEVGKLIYSERRGWYLLVSSSVVYYSEEETAVGRQTHNLRRELYRTNDFADIEMVSVIRHCYVTASNEFSIAANEGDDVFLCEYEYDIKWPSFKLVAEIDNNDGERANKAAADDEDWTSSNESDSVSEEEIEFEDETKISSLNQASLAYPCNSRKGRIFGLQKIGTRKIPEHVRCHK